MLWNLDILTEKSQIQASDLSKIEPLLNITIKSDNLENKITAIKLLNRLLLIYNQECHLQVLLSEETFRRLMRQLTESINQPSLVTLFQSSF